MKRSIFSLLIFLTGIFPGRAQDSRPLLTFGMVTDVHYADIPANGSKSYGQSLEKLQECVDTMNHYKVDFLIELGDFKDMSTPPSEEKALIFLYRVEKVLSQFKGARYHVLGNHDEDCISKSQFLSVAKTSGINETLAYYSFNKNGIHFIVLDANFDSTGKDFDRGRFNWGDPNIPEKELKWLKKDLRKARGTTLVFCHQLLDSEGVYYVNNAKNVRKVFEKSGKVAAVFQGHFHEGQYHLIDGIHYYTLRALVEGKGAESNSYAIVKIFPNTIEVKGFRRATSMAFSIGTMKYKKTGLAR